MNTKRTTNKRIEMLEQQLKPETKYYFVLCNENEPHEEAILRMMHENNVNKINEDDLLIICDIYGNKPATKEFYEKITLAPLRNLQT